MTLKEIYNIAPCLSEGPLSETGMALINEINKIPNDNIGNVIKTLITYYIFKANEQAFKKEEDPTNELLECLNKLTEVVKSFRNLKLEYFMLNTLLKEPSKNKSGDETGIFYGELFKNFDPDKYFNEAKSILKTRLMKNKVFPSHLGSKNVLDVGCGGGKYSLAWKQIGAKEVTGVDFSEDCINDAKARLKLTDLKVEYQVQDVLDLSFKNNSFDIVYCNGVLHHTKDFNKGISELVRVLKNDGLGWLYVIENPGGYFWDIIEIQRLIMKEVNKEEAIKVLKMMNISPVKIFRALDHVMAPINKRFTESEVTEALTKAGAKKIRKLNRGTEFDRIEKIYNKEPFAKLKYGGGEQIFVFSK